MPTDHRTELMKIRTFPQLVRYLRDEMGWPIEQDSFEDEDDLYYDFTPDELGLDTTTAAKIVQIRRLKRLSANQPWGIFFVKFAPGRLPVIALRRILNQVVVKKRATAKATERPAWAADDLLFVSNYGEGNERQISFAHFSQAEEKHDLPTLKVLGWDNLDTPLHLDAVAERLTTNLAWPEDDTNIEAWRKSWRSAFLLRHREVVTTSQDLSIRLAELARAIRDRIKTALAHENERGPLTKLMKAFQEALIHDLDADGFADMYAQTIAYGLLSARIAEPHKKTADDFATHMRTNPFLKELMQTFLHVGGRRGKAGGPGIDFDELGVSEIVELLDDANLKAVVMDFGDLKPEEDPVIHFYELFLKEYDKRQKVSRGVFYTPRSVVSYIVRSVDELLRIEFCLVDGLADTTTWGEMVKCHKDLKIPEGVTPDQDFVQILDPATGTGTFLIEVIEVIHKTLVAKWKSQGHREKKIEELWNEYVPKHLMPRLHGYELLMAPYAIAHLKISLKLYETGYCFGSNERARIYLTNALEPAQDFSETFEFAIPALAHEAEAVNKIKRNQRFTVVVGNPPYAGIPSNTSSPCQVQFRRQLNDGSANYFEVDGKSLGERNPKWLNDDYVKFMRYAQSLIALSDFGILGFITNHGYLMNPTFRGMRQSLMHTFPNRYILDLHGNTKRRELTPTGEADSNIFDIQQGVSISILSRARGNGFSLHHDLYHSLRSEKYQTLTSSSVHSTDFVKFSPIPPFYLFIPEDKTLATEYSYGVSLKDLFEDYGVGLTTARDNFVIDLEIPPLIERTEYFRDLEGSPDEVCAKAGIANKKGWDVINAQRLLRQEKSLESFVERVQYRPFDLRYIFYHDALVWRTVHRVMQHMRQGENLGLISARSNKSPSPDHFFCTRTMMETKCGEASTQSCLFPLKKYSKGESLLEKEFSCTSNLRRDTFPPSAHLKQADDETIFYWVYAQLHAPSYRKRFTSFFKLDFPRVFFSYSLKFFEEMVQFGEELVALHLMESPKLDNYLTTLVGSSDFQVKKVSYSDNTIWLDGAKRCGFLGVPETVWNFHIGGYQICEKWLKDRGPKKGKPGRILTDEDINHYQKIVVALNDTIRLMEEIDKTIKKHGGWPDAFSLKDKANKSPK